jgi:chaperone required for assembly of F1-ATPase
MPSSIFRGQPTMRDVLYSEHVPDEADPVKRAQIAMARVPLPKRFYKVVCVAVENDRFALKLDGRGARTPAKKPLTLPTAAAAALVAAEWDAQTDVINPHAMPATRIVNSALDGVADRIADVATETAGYAASDLVCYRATDPAGLAAAQALQWDPVVAWAGKALGAEFKLAQGIIHTEQSSVALQKVSDAVEALQEPIAMACLNVMTTLSGSCLITLMVAHGALSPDAAWKAATVDEDWSKKRWGEDAEAMARMKLRAQEFSVACALLKAVS